MIFCIASNLIYKTDFFVMGPSILQKKTCIDFPSFLSMILKMIALLMIVIEYERPEYILMIYHPISINFLIFFHIKMNYVLNISLLTNRLKNQRKSKFIRLQKKNSSEGLCQSNK